MTLEDIATSYLHIPAKVDKFKPFIPNIRCRPNSCHDGSKSYAEMLDDEKKWFGDKNTTLNEAIDKAVKSKYKCGLHHTHQKRMRTLVYKEVITDIQAQIVRIENTKILMSCTMRLSHASKT